MGLVRLALAAAPRWHVKRLTDTYLSLSLAEIGREIGLAPEPAVRALVVSMARRLYPSPSTRVC
jgi:COP9 signalosome complex subunit 3